LQLQLNISINCSPRDRESRSCTSSRFPEEELHEDLLVGGGHGQELLHHKLGKLGQLAQVLVLGLGLQVTPDLLERPRRTKNII
jgi:uncharacterized membrane protein YsdA (DUF1294 family)